MDPALVAYVGHSYGGSAGGVLAAIVRHVRESASPYWAEMKRDERALVQCARFDTPDNVRACPDVYKAAGGEKWLEWYDDDHDFTSLEAKRDRLYWLEKQLGLKGVAKALRVMLLR